MNSKTCFSKKFVDVVLFCKSIIIRFNPLVSGCVEARFAFVIKTSRPVVLENSNVKHAHARFRFV